MSTRIIYKIYSFKHTIQKKRFFLYIIINYLIVCIYIILLITNDNKLEKHISCTRISAPQNNILGPNLFLLYTVDIPTYYDCYVC